VVVDLLQDLLHQRFMVALMVRHGSPPRNKRERERVCVSKNENSVNCERERERDEIWAVYRRLGGEG
jgi:hypothetical protein